MFACLSRSAQDDPSCSTCLYYYARIAMPIICDKDTISYSYLMFGCRDDEDMRSTLDTNVMGVHRVIQAFLPLLWSGQKKTIINLGAMIGSMTVISKAVSARQL